jgi:hypothetical protein
LLVRQGRFRNVVRLSGIYDNVGGESTVDLTAEQPDGRCVPIGVAVDGRVDQNTSAGQLRLDALTCLFDDAGDVATLNPGKR